MVFICLEIGFEPDLIAKLYDKKLADLYPRVRVPERPEKYKEVYQLYLAKNVAIAFEK